MTDLLTEADRGAPGCSADDGGEHDWQLTGIHLSARGAAQTYTCGCGATHTVGAQMDPEPGHLEGVDQRPGLDFTAEDLTAEERRS